jgi:cytochrome c oxidase assembly protein subunit 15
MDRWTLSVRQFRLIAALTAGGLCLLVVAGGIVRLTGSGLGCDDWPNCNAQSFVDVSSAHAAIEQINRLISGAITIPTVLMVIGSFRVRPRRPGLVGPSMGVLVTVLANAVVGGLAVRADLHPALVQSHFLLAMASIAFALVAVRRSSPEPLERSAVPSAIKRLVGAMTVMTALALVTGTVVTGTGPHAGDEHVRRWGFDISTVARVHSATVLVAVALALAVTWSIRSDRASREQLGPVLSTWMFVAVVQGGIGYLQYFTGVPELLVGAHIAGATALWVITVWLWTALSGDASAVHRATVGARAEQPDVSVGGPTSPIGSV